MKNKKLRPLGQVTSDLEPLLFEMVYDHELQVHEIIGIIYQWIQLHADDAIEEFDEEGAPPPRLVYK